MLARSIRSVASLVKTQLRFATTLYSGYRWSEELEPHDLPSADEIIDENLIHRLLGETVELAKDASHVRGILQNARDRALLKHGTDPGSEYVQGLTLEETATLLNIDTSDNELMQDLYDTALDIKRTIYGNRIVLFAPLYVANYCVNTCTYCAYRGPNSRITRCHLTDDELIDQVGQLQKQGHRRVLMLTGEHPTYTFDHFLNALKVVSEVTTEPYGAIRRINVEIPPISVSDFRRLKATEVVGTYTVFQETYHRETYKEMHPRGPKSDYDYRLLAMDRAQIGGVDDVGLGALFGLYDYRFEVMGLMMHGQHLDKTYGAGPHTISIPRMQEADNAPSSVDIPSVVNDDQFRKLCAIIRCAVPYTGMILSTRESPAMREELLNLGISQMSAGSCTEVGGYHKGDPDAEESGHFDDVKGQFSLQDERTLDEVVLGLIEAGFVPSWCTACYRLGRTGAEFMKIAKCGDIKNFCHPNALLTLKEYLDDYASPETKKAGEALIATESPTIDKKSVRRAFEEKLGKIKDGDRDQYV